MAFASHLIDRDGVWLGETPFVSRDFLPVNNPNSFASNPTDFHFPPEYPTWTELKSAKTVQECFRFYSFEQIISFLKLTWENAPLPSPLLPSNNSHCEWGTVPGSTWMQNFRTCQVPLITWCSICLWQIYVLSIYKVPVGYLSIIQCKCCGSGWCMGNHYQKQPVWMRLARMLLFHAVAWPLGGKPVHKESRM